MLGERCSHGKTWAESCPECDLVSARETVRRWKPVVEEAERRIEELEKEREEA
jgi:hypothetical protein